MLFFRAVCASRVGQWRHRGMICLYDGTHIFYDLSTPRGPALAQLHIKRVWLPLCHPHQHTHIRSHDERSDDDELRRSFRAVDLLAVLLGELFYPDAFFFAVDVDACGTTKMRTQSLFGTAVLVFRRWLRKGSTAPTWTFRCVRPTIRCWIRSSAVVVVLWVPSVTVV